MDRRTFLLGAVALPFIPKVVPGTDKIILVGRRTCRYSVKLRKIVSSDDFTEFLRTEGQYYVIEGNESRSTK